MPERIILSIVAVVMLLFAFQKKDKLTISLTAGLVLGVLTTWAGTPSIILVGVLIYSITGLLISINCVRRNEYEKYQKTAIVTAGIWTFALNVFSVMHWPYGAELRLTVVVPLLLYLTIVLKGFVKKKEFGYMTIMNVEFLLRLVHL